MSKANNEIYGTSWIPPNQLGDANAIAEQVVFQGISTLSTFQLTNNDDWIQMYAVSPTLPPLFTTEVNIQSLPSIQALLGRTQHMGINNTNTLLNSDLDMNNNNIINVNEIDVQDINLDGHHLTTDANGNLLVDGQPADNKWFEQPVPTGSNITFLSANPLSPINTLYTPNGTDLWYNNVNLCSGGGGGGGEDWATYPANSNVLIPSPYGLSVGADAPVATFPTITLCGNTLIGRQSIVPLNAPNVQIYPYNFNVGDDLYPAVSIDLVSGVGGTTITSLEGISLDATVDVNINAEGAVALDAGVDINLLAVGEISMESANATIIAGGVEVGATTIVNTGATSIINTTPLFEINGAETNIASAITTVESGAISLIGSATANIASPLTTMTGAVLGIQSATTNMTSALTNINGTNVNIIPTGNITIGSYSPGGGGTQTGIAGNNISFNTLNTINFYTGNAGVSIGNNAPLKVGNITDFNGILNIRSQNASQDVVSLCNVAYINSVYGTNMNNVKLLNCSVGQGLFMSNINKIDFVSKPNIGEINAVSSIKGGGGFGDLSITATDLLFDATSDVAFNSAQFSVNAPTEIDLNAGNGALHIAGYTQTNNSQTYTLQTSTYSNLSAEHCYFTSYGDFVVSARSITFQNLPSNPIPTLTTPLINARNINTSSITTSSIYTSTIICDSNGFIDSFMNTNSVAYNISSPNVYIEVGNLGLDIKGNVQTIGDYQTYVPSMGNFVGMRQADYVDATISWNWLGGAYYDSEAKNPIGGGAYNTNDWICICSLKNFIAPSQGSGVVSWYVNAFGSNGVWWLDRYVQITAIATPVLGTITASILMIPAGFCS